MERLLQSIWAWEMFLFVSKLKLKSLERERERETDDSEYGMNEEKKKKHQQLTINILWSFAWKTFGLGVPPISLNFIGNRNAVSINTFTISLSFILLPFCASVARICVLFSSELFNDMQSTRFLVCIEEGSNAARRKKMHILFCRPESQLIFF